MISHEGVLLSKVPNPLLELGVHPGVEGNNTFVGLSLGPPASTPAHFRYGPLFLWLVSGVVRLYAVPRWCLVRTRYMDPKHTWLDSVHGVRHSRPRFWGQTMSDDPRRWAGSWKRRWRLRRGRLLSLPPSVDASLAWACTNRAAHHVGVAAMSARLRRHFHSNNAIS
jgi:hypothetical protein